MWNFTIYPAILRKKEAHGDYEVEVFGYIDALPHNNDTLKPQKLIVFRQRDVSLTFEMNMLPVEQFEERFKEYDLVEE